MKYLIPLHDSIEGLMAAWIYRKYDCCYVTVRTSPDHKKMQRLKDIAYLLYQANQANNFHFINLESEVVHLNDKIYNNDFTLFNAIKKGNMSFELEDAVYKNLARESGRILVQPYSQMDYILEKSTFYADELPLKDLNKSQLYKDAALFQFPSDLIAAYRQMDLEALDKVTDLTYGDIEWALNEEKKEILGKLLNSEYTEKQREALKFIKTDI